jgi:hypothetical protein
VQGLVVARVALPGPPLLCPLLVHWRLEVLASLSEVQLLVAVAAVAVQPGQGSCLGLGPLGQDRMHHSSSPPASNTHPPTSGSAVHHCALYSYVATENTRWCRYMCFLDG